jgi:hypothetical protein
MSSLDPERAKGDADSGWDARESSVYAVIMRTAGN